jgi:predicted amidohydrolase YtcJ
MRRHSLSTVFVALVLVSACADDSTTTTNVSPDTSSVNEVSQPPETSLDDGVTSTEPSTPPDDSDAAAPSGAATMVLHNGVIYTADDDRTMATAIAISGEKITAVGTDAEIEALIGPDTQVVDLDGQLVVPGLIDSHVHVVAGGAESTKCSFEDQILTIEQMKAIVEECLAAAPPADPDEWFQVVSINPAGLELTAADIDTMVDDRPVFFSGSDGHVAFVNTAALVAANITAATPDPADGKLERDAAGEPTGRLLDGAIGLIAPFFPQPSIEDYVPTTAQAIEAFNAVGLTAVRDPSVNDEIVGVYEALLADDALNVRVATSFTLNDMSLAPDALATTATDFASAHPGAPDRLVVDQVKVFADGVIEAPTWTAAMLEPYLDEQGVKTENSGDLYYDAELFPEQVAAIHKAGMSIHVHAVGDRATQTALDAFEFSPVTDGDARSPDQIVHLQVIDPADYGRFNELGVIAGFQPYWALRENYTVEALEPFVGPERYSRIYPIRSVQETGAVLAGGSDWPVTTFNPFEAMQRAVTRRDVASSEPLVADQAITVTQALDMYTRGAGASLPFAGVGIIAPGNPADIAVLSQNILEIDPYDIGTTVSTLTVVGGRVVYEAD